MSYDKFRGNVKVISQIKLLVLLIIVVAVAVSLVAYVWVKGDAGFTTNKAGNFSAWTGKSGLGASHSEAVETNHPHHGISNAIFVSPDKNGESWLYKTFNDSAITYFRYYIKIDSGLPATGSRLYLGTVRGSTERVQIYIYNNAGKYYWGLASSADGQVDSERCLWANYDELIASNPKTGVWYCLEVSRDNTNNVASLWVDGVQKVNQGITATQNNSRIDVGIGANPSGQNVVMYIDCVVVSDAYIGVQEGPSSALPITGTFSDGFESGV